MDRHEITVQSLDEWLADDASQWVRFAGSFGTDTHKVFEICGGELFRVTDNGVVTYIGGNKVSAVAAYNDAR